MDFYCKISLQIPKIPKISRLRRATLTFLAFTFGLKSANFQLKSAKPGDHGGGGSMISGILNPLSAGGFRDTPLYSCRASRMVRFDICTVPDPALS